MVSRNEDKINFNKLEQELAAAVEADAKYERENDAKFRAVHQKVASYDEFRDIVMASHLRPLEKGDKITRESFKQPWNSLAGAYNQHDDRLLKQQQTTSSACSKLPKTSYEFSRLWRQIGTSDAKYQLLIKLGASRLKQLFRAEISSSLLSEFISVLNENYTESNSKEILLILDALRTAQRFGLSVGFLSNDEKDICAKLFGRLNQSFTNTTSESEGYSPVDLQEQLSVVVKHYQ